LDGYIRKFSKQSVHTAPSLIITGGNVHYVLNRSGGNNLQDKLGFVYKKSKSVPLTDKSYWLCMWKKKYSCRNLNKLDRDQKLKNLVNNFHNLSLDTFMESLIPYYESVFRIRIRFLRIRILPKN
jgi:hypothetical protein